MDEVRTSTPNSADPDTAIMPPGSTSPKPEETSKVPDTPPVIRFPCCPRPFANVKMSPLPPDRVELITGESRCRQVVARLLKEKVLALAAEGINIGKEGPVTLVQLATCSGHVYIFDVLENRDLVHAGRLRYVLESVNVLKVVHDCSRLNAALTYQFATSLANVFDTQIAHLVMERHRGRRLPAGVSVSQLCLQYSETVHRFYTYDWRTQSKATWMSMVGNFWATRPLTPDMIEFAACDVIVLIPDVYRHQSEYIDTHKLRRTFQEEVDMWLLIDMDDVIREKHGRRVFNDVTSVLAHIDRKYDDRASVFNILDEDEIHALSLTTYEDASAVSVRVRNLKKALILKELDEVELNLRTETDSWEERGNMLEYLRYHQTIPDAEISKRAIEIFNETRRAILEHIEEKYNTETNSNMLTISEKDGLLTIPYSDIADGHFGPVTTAIYWKLMQEEIHGMINCLRFSPNQFTLTEEEYSKVSSLASEKLNQIPEDVSALATGLVHSLRAFNAASGGYTIDKRRSTSAL